MSEPAGDKAAESGSTTFWKTVPGILTGVAALVTAVGGLIVVLVQVFGVPGQDSPADPAARSSPHTAISETAATSSEAPSKQPESGVLHRDQFEMKNLDYVDLETGVVGNPPGPDFFWEAPAKIHTINPMTTASGPITKANCVAALVDRDDRGADLSLVKGDQWLCAQTREENLSGLRIVRRPSPGNPTIVFESVVWK